MSQVLYGREFSRYKRTHAVRITEHHNIYPDTYRVEIDYRGARGAVRQATMSAYERWWRRFSANGAQAYAELVEARFNAGRDEQRVKQMLEQASHATRQSIDRAVRNAQMGLEAATAIRNFCSTTLLIGAGMVSGGALSAVGAQFALAGAGLSGVGTYQDTGSVGAAVLNATTSFAFALIPLTPRAGASVVERRALFCLGVKLNALSGVVNSLAQGDDFQTSVRSAVVSAGLSAVDEQLGSRFYESLSAPVGVLAQAGASTGQDHMVSAALNGSSNDSPELARLRGAMSAAAATAIPRSAPDRAFAENYVQLFAMNSATQHQAPSRAEFMRALRAMN